MTKDDTTTQSHAKTLTVKTGVRAGGGLRPRLQLGSYSLINRLNLAGIKGGGGVGIKGGGGVG